MIWAFRPSAPTGDTANEGSRQGNTDSISPDEPVANVSESELLERQPTPRRLREAALEMLAPRLRGGQP